MKNKISHYRPAAAAFLSMMAMGLTSSTLSFFLEPICEALQVGRGSFTLMFSLMTVSGALSTPVLGQIAGKKGVRGIMLLSGLWGGGSFLLMSMTRSLLVLYISGFLLGLLGSSCVSLCANVVVQRSFDEREASGILGLVMAGSGVGGVIFNLVIPGIMAGQGWQAGIRGMAVCWAGVMIIGALLLGKEKIPEYTKTVGSVGLGMTRQEAMKSPKLYLMVIVVVATSVCCGLQQQQPSLLAGHGFAPEKISLILSVQTAVLAAAKVGQGILYGGFGVRRGGTATLAIFALGMLMLTVKALVYPALVLVAIGLGIYTTLFPLVTRQVFGTREYAAIWSLIATAGSVGTVVLNPLWGVIYDASGSYTIALIGGPVLLAGAIWALNRMMGDRR